MSSTNTTILTTCSAIAITVIGTRSSSEMRMDSSSHLKKRKKKGLLPLKRVAGSPVMEKALSSAESVAKAERVENTKKETIDNFAKYMGSLPQR